MRRITNVRALKIGEVAQAIGVSVETIRYWERLALARRPQRSANGHRLYEPNDVRRLEFLHRARKLGFGHRDLRALVRLAASDRSSCSQAREIAARHRARIREKIAELTAIDIALEQAVNLCSDDQSDECPILQALHAGDPRANAHFCG
jgi:DNA-binding transcriptional MerR regulator